MPRTTKHCVVYFMLCACGIWFSVVAKAQDPGTTSVPGNTTVYSSTTTTSLAYSGAYIDASVFYYYDVFLNLPGTDLCAIINQILKGKVFNNNKGIVVSYPGSGAVIDARGILNLPDNNNKFHALTCASNPFDGVTNGGWPGLSP